MIILDSVCRFWPGKYQKAARKHPDAATMQRYFSKVRQISGQDWMHRLIMVLCSASGSMTLEDGAKRAGKLDPAARLSSELMEGHTRNTSSFARKRIAVFRRSGNKHSFSNRLHEQCMKAIFLETKACTNLNALPGICAVNIQYQNRQSSLIRRFPVKLVRKRRLLNGDKSS